jgi:O-antigen/teichoic acid export membrane protein
MVDLSAQVLAMSVMVGFAWWRHSIWALVAGSLVSVSVRLILSHLAFPGPVNRLCWRPDAIRELFTFGRWIFVSTMFTFLGLQTDKLILGRLVPLDLLGVYAVAFAMTATVAGIFEQLAYRVLMPAMVHVSKVSNSRFAEVVLRSRRLILMGAAIAVANLIILAPAIFRLLYDSRYQGAAHMTQLLASGLWFTLLQRTGEACLLATDRSRALAQANALNFLVTILAAPMGFHWFGMSGFIVGWTLGNLAAVIVLDWELIRHGVPVAWQDVSKTLLLVGFSAAGRLMQLVLHGYLTPNSLYWLAEVLPAMAITLAGTLMLFLQNRSLMLLKSGTLREPTSA